MFGKIIFSKSYFVVGVFLERMDYKKEFFEECMFVFVKGVIFK